LGSTDSGAATASPVQKAGGGAGKPVTGADSDREAAQSR
jgi:hypothetical protein